MSDKEILLVKKTLVFTSPHPFDRIMVWDISEKYMRDAAYIQLFDIMDGEVNAFFDRDSVVCALHPLARKGNPEACEALLCYTRNKEPCFQEIEVTSAFGVRLVEPRRPVIVVPVDISDLDMLPEPT